MSLSDSYLFERVPTCDFFGITRFKEDYSKGPSGWLVRMGHKYGERVKFQMKINDQDYNNDCELSLFAALCIRDNELEDHWDVYMPSRERVPVNRIYRNVTSWIVFYPSEDRYESAYKSYRKSRFKTKSFRFINYESEKDAFIAAVKFRKSKEIRHYGSSNINLDNIDELYELTFFQKIYRDKRRGD